MKQIIVTINPQDDERCGECSGFEIRAVYPSMKRWCMIFEREVKAIDAHETLRHEECLAAERKLTELVEAVPKLIAAGKWLFDAETPQQLTFARREFAIQVHAANDALAAIDAAVAKRLG